MENTFFRPRAVKRETEKRLAEAKAAAEEWDPAQANILAPAKDAGPAADAGPTARLRTMAFQPREMIALSQLALSPDADAAAASFRLRVEETPAEFVHLYAGLERLVRRVGGLSTVTSNLMETDRPYLLGVTSAVAGEGKTTTALHLAMTIARSTTKRVCLIDLSLSANGPAGRLGMPPGEGPGAGVRERKPHRAVLHRQWTARV